MVLKVLDSTGATQSLSTSLDASSNLVGATSLTDPSSGSKCTVAQFHNADNQNPGGTANGLLTGGVAQLLNVVGNLDRQRETGVDGIPSQGVASGAAQFAMAFSTTDSTDNFAAGTRTFTPVAMSGSINGVSWSIQVGSVLVLDSGANVENVVVTAVTGTTFTCVTAKAHNGTTTPFTVTGFVYNQERDAAGELDGASGAGTAVAVEYEFNGGGLTGTANYDRARNLQAKGSTTTTLNGAVTAGGSSIVVASAAGIMPGQWLWLTGGTPEQVKVLPTYTIGNLTVPIVGTLAQNHGNGTNVIFSSFNINGPQGNYFPPDGEGGEALILFDPTQTAPLQYGIARMAPGQAGTLLVSSDGVRATYRYGSIGNTPAATPTDIFTIAGSASKTIRVKSIKLNGVATANGNMPVALIRRSALDTTGTLTNPTPVKQDNTNDAAATATLALYTANPGALGAVLGTNGMIATARLFMTTTATGSPVPTVFDFCTRQDKAIILRGTADNLAVNLQGAAVPAGGLVDIEIEWEEDAS